MASPLAPVAEISNGLFIIVILCSLIAMVIFILRIREGIYETSVRYVQNITNARPMICVHNPFVLSFKNASTASLSDIPLNISIQVQSMLQGFWGVSVENLNWLSSLSWTSLKNLLSDEASHDFCISKSIVHNIDICWDSTLRLSPLEEVSSDDLGELPRMKYPLVIVLVRTSDLLATEDCNTVIATIIVIHIKDLICQMESQFLAQYLKQTSGQTCSLKQLYMSSASTALSRESYNSNENFEEIDSFCVVCQALPVTRAILPCRHTCVCYRCFPRLERCPICRALIQSYFCIQQENHSNVAEENTVPFESLSWGQRWEQLNERLNQWLGLVDRF